MIYFFLAIFIPGFFAVLLALGRLVPPREREGEHGHH